MTALLSRACVWFALGCACASVAGCDTDDELRAQQLVLLDAEQRALHETIELFQKQPKLDAPRSIHLFVSANLLNNILSAANGMTIDLPAVDGAKLTINSVKTDLRFGLGGIAIKAGATKADLGATVNVVGVARLNPVLDPTNPGKVTLRILIENLVPDAHWGLFDFKISGFIREIAKVKSQQTISAMPAIIIPVATDIPLAAPAAPA